MSDKNHFKNKDIILAVVITITTIAAIMIKKGFEKKFHAKVLKFEQGVDTLDETSVRELLKELEELKGKHKEIKITLKPKPDFCHKNQIFYTAMPYLTRG